jgi:hypothetical protein
MTDISKRNDYNKIYYQKNKKHIDDKNKKWRKKHPKQSRIIAKRYSDKNKELIVKRGMDWKRKNRALVTFRQAVLRMKKRGHMEHITFENFSALMCKPCSYCGSEEKINTVDRINSNSGYVNGNVQTLCFRCNIMKSNLNQEEFLHHVSRIYEHNEMERP